jgi:hypothetical protein
MQKRLTFPAGLLALAAILLTGCNTQPNHPNQINAFDGTSYDSLTLAHGALTALRAHVASDYKQYAPTFNEAAEAYSAAFDAYSLYHTNSGTPAAVSVALSNLAINIAALENAFQTQMNLSPSEVISVHRKAAKLRSAAAPRVSAIDILTELEIAATLAQTVPASAPYAKVAAAVIDATQQALAAQAASSGRDIDLSTVTPVPFV